MKILLDHEIGTVITGNYLLTIPPRKANIFHNIDIHTDNQYSQIVNITGFNALSNWL